MESSQDEQSSEPAVTLHVTAGAARSHTGTLTRSSTATLPSVARTGRELAPSDYTKSVVTHAGRDKGRYLSPGTNYFLLSDFLSRPKPRNPLTSVTPSSIPGSQVALPFAVLHCLGYGPRDPKRLATFFKPEDLYEFEAHSDPEGPGQDHGDVLFLRGYPSPEWVSVVGAKYRLDPEIFRRHLKLPNSKDYFELPGLPSSDCTLELRIPSIGEVTSGTSKPSDAARRLRLYWQSLGAGGRAGESIVRRFHRHGTQYFSIEQRMTISVRRRPSASRGSWISIVMLDNGLDLEDCPPGPWFTALEHIHDIFNPVIQTTPDAALRSPNHDGVEVRPSASPSPRSRTHQTGALLGLKPLGPRLKLASMNKWPLYAVHDLLVFAASAEQQFLNFIATQLNIDYNPFFDKDWMENALGTYSYHQDILQDHADYLAKVCQQLSINDHDALWIQVAGDQDPAPLGDMDRAVRETCEAVRRDWEHLACQVQGLLQLVRDKKDNVNHDQAAVEAKRTYEQSLSAAKLTFLAFLFLPWSLCTAVFGMNVQQLGTDGVDIVYVFAFGIPLFVLSLLGAYWVVGRLPW
ncbi:hypothetical protein B0T19DRAFT_431906 [Cercophora scortea]|uniref:Uncharacterized protein n=1 Tax=Cercophora scortea TaxID=314031 RepID=A0AAE0IA09_9PEZI|nr:hypothetical protein B0T19DRAFT_431906 [Cercophora scortea]